jgi:protein SCO1
MGRFFAQGQGDTPMDESRRTFSLLALNVAPLAGLTPWLLSLFGAGEREPSMPGTGTPSELSARHFPNVVFRTQDDRRVRFYDDLIKGNKVLINFMYTECTNTCPRTTANLVKVQDVFRDRLGRDLLFISISLTPDRDTPAGIS